MGPEGQEVRGNPQNSQFYFIQFFLLKYGGEGTLGESAFETY